MHPRYLLPAAALWMTGCLTVAGLDKDYTDDLGKSGAAGRAGTGGSSAAGSNTGGATGGVPAAGASGAASGGAGTGGSAEGGGAGAPQAGAGGGGTSSGGAGAGGQPTAGKAGSQALGGGPAATCPPPEPTFTGLPACGETDPFPCAKCVCNDIAVATGCGAKYKACLNDLACSKTIECLFRGCTLTDCEPLVGASVKTVNDFVSCMNDPCATSCK